METHSIRYPIPDCLLSYIPATYFLSASLLSIFTVKSFIQIHCSIFEASLQLSTPIPTCV